jgi:hypothetical protein
VPEGTAELARRISEHYAVYKITKDVFSYLLNLLEVEIMKCKLVEVLRVVFQLSLWKDLWDTWKIPFMALGNLGYIKDQ